MHPARLLYVFIAFLIIPFTGCNDEPPKINYDMGTFPDTVIAMTDLNSQFDDYNSDLEAAVITSAWPIIFSSNRETSGGTFNLVTGRIGYSFGQTTGTFTFFSEPLNDNFLTALVQKFNTPANELGPRRFFNGDDGFEYMVAATDAGGEGLDMVFSKYVPAFSTVPPIPSPVPVSCFNSSSDDGYITLNPELDTAYFCSDRSGNFNIFMLVRPASIGVDEWFKGPAANPAPVDSISTAFNEKCPFIAGRYMVFVSDMPGGSGGLDLYYSVFSNGKWSSAINMGPRINTEYNEYRPVLGADLLFTNYFMIFSSDRPGGKGGYDLYFTGVTFE